MAWTVLPVVQMQRFQEWQIIWTSGTVWPMLTLTYEKHQFPAPRRWMTSTGENLHSYITPTLISQTVLHKCQTDESFAGGQSQLFSTITFFIFYVSFIPLSCFSGVIFSSTTLDPGVFPDFTSWLFHIYNILCGPYQDSPSGLRFILFCCENISVNT